MAESTKLDMALARFEDAVDRLEGILRSQRQVREADALGEQQDGSAQMSEELAALRAENEELRLRNELLEEANGQALSKVDHAVSRIRSVLGED
ncbi:hypothetical protein [Rhodoligotrophos defluvii]|uniref:hypothetical protein n=1 Tax=Rhodoligotrophos defluvii TaxID=2561934 RepID=UPI0010C9E4EE|nr:hypothetical protein [Rhodoligotrophos defluvii]